MNFIINTLEENMICAKLLFTDTDSIIYEIETNDVYENFYNNKKFI